MIHPNHILWYEVLHLNYIFHNTINRIGHFKSMNLWMAGACMTGISLSCLLLKHCSKAWESQPSALRSASWKDLEVRRLAKDLDFI